MLPGELIEELAALNDKGYTATVEEADGWAIVVFEEYGLPKGYSRKATTLLLKLPMSYPNGNPDMFWTDTDVLLEGGGTPRNAEVIETISGRQWRRFSWHPTKWNPATDDLATYVEFVERRLEQVV